MDRKIGEGGSADLAVFGVESGSCGEGRCF